MSQGVSGARQGVHAVSGGYAFRRSALTQQQYDIITSDLTFENGAYYQAQKRGVSTEDIPRYLTAYREEGDTLILPRHTNWAKYRLRPPLTQEACAPIIEAPTPYVKFRPKQRAPFNALYDRLCNRQDGILSLSCGFGKTTISVTAWASLDPAVPGLAVVTTKAIGEQWIGRRTNPPRGLLGFTDIDESDIGMIGDGRNDWRGKKFVVATLQSLSLKEFPPEFYSYFGVVFFDECHRLGAPNFSVVGHQFPGIRVGLSATWARADRLERLFMMHIGPVFHENHEQPVTPDVYFAKTPVTVDLAGFRMWKGRSGEVNHAKVITHLSRLDDRHHFIVEHVRAARTENRKVLVLGDRKEELLALQALLPQREVGICVGALDGRAQSPERRERALKQPIVLATSQLVKEGLDQPDIDTLIILYAQSNSAFAEQAAGRILRQLEGKQPPVVVVLNDAGLFLDEGGLGWGKSRTRIYPFRNICKRMEENFRRLGYTIQRAA